jgi:DNA-binding NarL/FixJ family response regulator
MIRAIICDDHPIVREGVRLVLGDSKDIVLEDEATNGHELLEKISKRSFDLIILDISYPEGPDGLGPWKRPVKRAHERPSDQEYTVLCLLAAGRRFSAAVRKMGLSPSTVGTYRSQIMGKLGLGNNAEMIRYALKNGLIE